MDTWTEALMTMMNTTDDLLLHSEVKKEKDTSTHDGYLAADSSLYSPIAARLEFQIELSQSDMIPPGSCESYETTPTSVVGSSSSGTEPDELDKQHCSSTTPADSNNPGQFRSRIQQEDLNERKAISTVSAALYQSSPRSLSSPEPDTEQVYCSSTTSLLGGYDQLSNRGEYKDENGPKRLCLVCGDIASGFHYGVASCEACKAFFKRTIQGNIEYTCPAANDCEINKRRRKACQACRFRKCIMMGMLKEGVRLDRVRGGRQKYRRVVPYAINSPSKHNEGRGHLLRLLMQSEVESSRSAVTQRSVPANTDSVTRTLCILSDIYDKELVSTIGWAKQIPVFTELPLNDQMRLLQTTWPEILTLSLAYRSHPLGSDSPKLTWAPDFAMGSAEAAECSLTDFYVQTLQIGRRLEQLSATREEYVLLKALVLANSDIFVENCAPLQRLKSSLLSELADYVNTRQDATDTRLHHLLLCLPCVRQVDPIVRDFWTALRLEMPQIPMNKLFLEMLETPCR